MKRALKPEDSALIFIIGFVLYQVLGIFLGMIFPNGGDWYTFLAFTIPQICYIGTIIGYNLAAKTEFSVLPKRENVKAIHYLMAALVGIGLFFFALLPNQGLQLLFEKWGKNLTVTAPSMSSPLNIVLGVILICILPAIGEELVFRKAFCDGFKRYGEVNAVILSGVLFGLSHMSLAQTVHQIFLGMALAYIYMKTENVTLTMIIHFLNNLLALFLSVITGEAVWSNFVVLGISCAAGGALLFGGLAYFFLKTRKLGKKSEEKPSIFIIGFIVAMALLWLLMAIIFLMQ